MPLCFVVVSMIALLANAAFAESKSVPARNLNVLLWQSEAMERVWVAPEAPTCSHVAEKVELLAGASAGLKDELRVIQAAVKTTDLAAVAAAYAHVGQAAGTMNKRMEQAMAICSNGSRAKPLLETGMNEMLQMEVLRFAAIMREECKQVAKAGSVAVDCR